MKINVSKPKEPEVTIKLTLDESAKLSDILEGFNDDFAVELKKSIRWELGI